MFMRVKNKWILLFSVLALQQTFTLFLGRLAIKNNQLNSVITSRPQLSQVELQDRLVIDTYSIEY